MEKLEIIVPRCVAQGAIIPFLMQSLMGETNASRLRRETPTGCATCFMPGNPSTAMAYRLQRWLPKTALHRYFKPSAVAHGGDPQDRAALYINVWGFSPAPCSLLPCLFLTQFSKSSASKV